ncbi:MAG TPA: hypothetical protein VJR89_43260, partial [Polyangiales bacterium]|nr:hypothetical protein [Polyangiales bacterium]
MNVLRVALVCSLIVACSCSDDGGEARREDDSPLLSQRGLYSDIAARRVVKAAFEYAPDYALWSDAADKRRWLILPEGQRVDTSDMAHWMFPVGTKLFKEFSRNGKLLETRLVERIADSGFFKNDYFMGTFIWRADQSDAVLTAEGKDNVLGTEHDVPRQKACPVCHRGEPGAVLGFSAVQLSASGRLEDAVRQRLLSDPPEHGFELPGGFLDKVALGTLHANCGHCHAEAGMADFMHLRFLPEEAGKPVEELEAYRTTVGVELSDEWENRPPEFLYRIVPGDPDASSIAYRMGQRGDDELVPDQMPPLATRKVDRNGLAAVRAWIESLQAGVPDAGTPDAGEREDASPPAADSGGAAAGSGGVAGSGGTSAGSGGASARNGGAAAGSGGTSAVSSGVAAGSGGA